MNNFECYDKPREKCAVVGVVEKDNASLTAIDALRAMQHRGPEASGVTSMAEDGILNIHRELGLVKDVYRDPQIIASLAGSLAIGHNRYSTSGDKKKHSQPVVDESIGFSLGHNGNLTDTAELEEELKQHNVIISRLNDSEMMARTIATKIREGQTLPDAIADMYNQFNGAFSCVAMHDGQVVAFRDRFGIRPLSYGSLPDNGWVIASETCGLDTAGADFINDIKPGQMMVFTPGYPPKSTQLAEGKETLDIFEFVYFARPDSMLYGESVYEVRRRFGEELADLHASFIPDNAIVVPVPDTSIPASEGFSEKLDIRTRQAIVKDRYVGRTFILPTEHERQKQLKIKHNIAPMAVKNKDVVVIDDSIVRLNTIPIIVERLKASGAKSVTVLIASPPVRYPDFYGIDTPRQSKLAAHHMTVEEMRKAINAEYLGFLSLDGMIRATRSPKSRFNLSCFNGEYPIPIGDWKNAISEPVSREYID